MQTTRLTNEQRIAIKKELTILAILAILEGFRRDDSIFRRVATYSLLLNKLGIPTYRNYINDIDEITKEVQGDS